MYGQSDIRNELNDPENPQKAIHIVFFKFSDSVPHVPQFFKLSKLMSKFCSATSKTWRLDIYFVFESNLIVIPLLHYLNISPLLSPRQRTQSDGLIFYSVPNWNEKLFQ